MVRRRTAVTGLNVIKTIYATNTPLKDAAAVMKRRDTPPTPAHRSNADTREKDSRMPMCPRLHHEAAHL